MRDPYTCGRGAVESPHTPCREASNRAKGTFMGTTKCETSLLSRKKGTSCMWQLYCMSNTPIRIVPRKILLWRFSLIKTLAWKWLKMRFRQIATKAAVSQCFVHVLGNWHRERICHEQSSATAPWHGRRRKSDNATSLILMLRKALRVRSWRTKRCDDR